MKTMFVIDFLYLEVSYSRVLAPQHSIYFCFKKSSVPEISIRQLDFRLRRAIMFLLNFSPYSLATLCEHLLLKEGCLPNFCIRRKCLFVHHSFNFSMASTSVFLRRGVRPKSRCFNQTSQIGNIHWDYDCLSDRLDCLNER